MPLYDFKCETCAYTFEYVTPYEQRHLVAQCPDCRSYAAKYEGITAVKTGSPPYQMGIVTSTGQKIPGHFGKTAKRKRG